MKFRFNREQEKLRQDVVEFIREEIEAGTFVPEGYNLVGGPNREFSRKMSKKGWIGITWPKKYGGQELGYMEKMIIYEELYKVRAPVGFHFANDRQIGPAIIAFGSDWQKEYFLPRFIKAEDGFTFCLLFSEPDAGSDLAAVSTTAVKAGDHYIVNGQKVWTSGGERADYGWMLAKTNLDPKTNRYATCSEFIVNMKTPGITIRPIRNMTGDSHFAEVFFDDAKIPEQNLVGQENAGFLQIMAQVDHERAGLERLMQNYMVYKRLKSYISEDLKEEKDAAFVQWVRDAFAHIEIDFNVGRLLCYYTAWMLDQKQNPSSQAALCKAFCTQYEQRLNDVATKVLGPLSLIRRKCPFALFGGDMAESYLWGPSYTLQGGSVEVLKNIVAFRGIGLPRK